MCDLIGNGRVITIDIESEPPRPDHPRITYLTGWSVDPDIVATVQQSIVPEEKVLVLLDPGTKATTCCRRCAPIRPS